MFPILSAGAAFSAPDALTITATGDNAPPVARTISAVGAEDCTKVRLDCSDSYDPEGADLTWYWEMQEVPEGSSVTNDAIADRSAAETWFYPDVAGPYALSCSVFDGSVWSDPALVAVTTTERATNRAPELDAGIGRSGGSGSAPCPESAGGSCVPCPAVDVLVGRDATISDPDGDPLTVWWDITSGNGEIDAPFEVPVTVTVHSSAPGRAGVCTT